MANQLASWSFLFHFLLLMCAQGNGSRVKIENNNIIRLPNTKEAHQDGHMHHMVHPSAKVFFTLKDLKIGSVIATSLPKLGSSKYPPLFTREKAESIPFSLKHLPYLLHLFSISPDSPQASAMEDALRQCESEPIRGETKFCATSLESMLDFVSDMIGQESRFQVLVTRHLADSSSSSSNSGLVKNYTIIEATKEMSPSKMVACHTTAYPYTIYLCHGQSGGNKVFKILLDGENGEKIEAVSVCHMDTSNWSPDHVSFMILGTHPGASEVCHFFPEEHLVWVPADP
ncbi:hypothetical protein Tsubulata_003403 [Turnera subulata]|uniref:BURP domain-containing protein n=1 Tax=Turnera subulata TaxID=218843 RepID=A0A9Q0FFL7_9ROSI|nr:hypothetical protein Tsubulata_003403 [Turnera subulata]